MLLTHLLLAGSLAVDAAAASLAIGLTYHRQLRARSMVLIALVFGGFQAAMPLIGWQAVGVVAEVIQPFDHWIAFILLTVIGANMIRNSRRNADDKPPQILNVRTVIGVGIATSLDALAAGLSLPTLTTSPGLAIATIGVVTAGLSAVALFMARRLPLTWANPAEFLGGLVLIGIGLKVLLVAVVIVE